MDLSGSAYSWNKAVRLLVYCIILQLRKVLSYAVINVKEEHWPLIWHGETHIAAVKTKLG